MKTESVLSFAYQMRDFYEGYLKETEDLNIPNDTNKLKQLRRILASLHPDYKNIHEMILACENEIAYNEAKQNGRSGEKQRTKAAKKILKKNKNKEALQGYLKPSDDEIAITNGFILYIGKPIINIEETTFPEKFFNVREFVNRIDIRDYEEETELDIAKIKSNYKIANTKAIKGKKELYKYLKDAVVEFTNGKGINTYFDAELIIDACDLIGGGCYTIQISNTDRARYSPAIIKGENGTCYVMPFNHKEENYR